MGGICTSYAAKIESENKHDSSNKLKDSDIHVGQTAMVCNRSGSDNRRFYDLQTTATSLST